MSSLRGMPEELMKATKEREKEAREEQQRAQRQPEFKGGFRSGRPLEDASKPPFSYDDDSSDEDDQQPPPKQGGWEFGPQRQERAATMSGWEAPPRPTAPPRQDPYAEFRTAAPGKYEPRSPQYDDYRQQSPKAQRQDPWQTQADPWKQSDPWSMAGEPRSKPTQPSRRRSPEGASAPPYPDYSQWNNPGGEQRDFKSDWGGPHGVGLPARDPKPSPYPPKSKSDYPDLL